MNVSSEMKNFEDCTISFSWWTNIDPSLHMYFLRITLCSVVSFVVQGEYLLPLEGGWEEFLFEKHRFNVSLIYKQVKKCFVNYKVSGSTNLAKKTFNLTYLN